ncbi:MAG TPA: interleukin-like EMT inducer domain-containing protein [Anaerolineae bacterium]|nr:interleukin-like EMT inducer domain-containing protein [Anaerolineae bacterium]
MYIVLAVASTYPLALHLTTHVPGRGTDDPALTWNLWWMKFALFDIGTNPLYSNYIFYPIGVNLVAYTSTVLNAILALSLQFAFGVIAAQNVYTLSALVISGYGAYLLSLEMMSRTTDDGRRTTDRRPPTAYIAAGIAGAFYAFGAWHISYVAAGHFMLLSNQWIPFLALMLFRFDRPTWHLRDAFLAGLFFVCAAWTELTFIPFISLLTGSYFVYILLARRDALRLQLAYKTILFVLVVGIGVAPIALNLLFDTLHYGYYLAPGLGRVQIFSAEPISYFLPSAQHPILGAWANAITTANTSYAFIGWAALAFAIIGLVTAWKRPEARFWGALALFFGLVLLGATLIINGNDTHIPMPFALLRLLPFVNANRYPVRFNVMLMLSLTPLIAFGAAWLLQKRWSTLALWALVVVLIFEQLVLPIPLDDLRAGDVFEIIANEPGDFTVMDLPLGWRNSVAIQGAIDFGAQFLQTSHHKRLLGGLTSRNPLFKYQYFREIPILNSLILLEEGETISDAQRAQDKQFVNDILRFFDIRYIEVNQSRTDAAVLEYIQSLFPLTEIFRDDERIVYRVNIPPPLANAAIDPAAESSRMLFDDMWGRAQVDNSSGGYRWATDSHARLWLPLADTDYDMTFRLRGAHPNQHIQLRVNDNRVAEWNISDAWGEYTAHLPRTALRDGLDEFVFVTDTTPLAQASQDDRVIGSTGIESPVDIAVVGAGLNGGKFGEIVVNGRNLIPNTRGYHLVAIHPQTGRVDAVDSFDTNSDKTESARLAQFIADLPQGEIVAGAAIDDASQALTPKAFAALQTVGVAGDLRNQLRVGHAFVGIKGIAPGQAVEEMNDHLPANVAIGKNVNQDRVAFALGVFEIEQR